MLGPIFDWIILEPTLPESETDQSACVVLNV